MITKTKQNRTLRGNKLKWFWKQWGGRGSFWILAWYMISEELTWYNWDCARQSHAKFVIQKQKLESAACLSASSVEHLEKALHKFDGIKKRLCQFGRREGGRVRQEGRSSSWGLGHFAYKPSFANWLGSEKLKWDFRPHDLGDICTKKKQSVFKMCPLILQIVVHRLKL